ncbi:hypothetical protein, partial [Tsukamurella pulmonis]|uniref:hypothetical protein n=1 Tax=Tsukamurella pulmonis TaxID=47312 RepID=UPI001A9DB8B0
MAELASEALRDIGNAVAHIARGDLHRRLPFVYATGTAQLTAAVPAGPVPRSVARCTPLTRTVQDTEPDPETWARTPADTVNSLDVTTFRHGSTTCSSWA